MNFQPSKHSDYGGWLTDTLASYLPGGEAVKSAGTYIYESATGSTLSRDTVPISEVRKALAEAELAHTNRLKRYADLVAISIRDENPNAAKSLEKELADAAKQAENQSYAQPDKTAAHMVSALAIMQAIAARNSAPITREKIVTALKWVSSGGKVVPASQPEPKDDGQNQDNSWILPVAIAGCGALGLGAYYYFYIRPKSR